MRPAEGVEMLVSGLDRTVIFSLTVLTFLVGCTEYIEHGYSHETQILDNGVEMRAGVLGTQKVIRPGLEESTSPYKLVLTIDNLNSGPLCISQLSVRSGSQEQHFTYRPPECGNTVERELVRDQTVYYSFDDIQAEMGSDLQIEIDGNYLEKDLQVRFYLQYQLKTYTQFVLFDSMDEA